MDDWTPFTKDLSIKKIILYEEYMVDKPFKNPSNGTSSVF